MSYRTGRRDGRDLYQMYIRDENKLSAVRLHAANNKYDEYPSKHTKKKTNKQTNRTLAYSAPMLRVIGAILASTDLLSLQPRVTFNA
jgi:hypothetical protein